MRLITGTLLVGLLSLSAESAAADEMTAAALVARKAAILDLLHDKAQRALVNAAQDHAYGRYFEPDDRLAEGHKTALKQRIDKVSLAVQSRFHVEEMCLIDPEGAEVSRIVGNEVAHDLATDEASAIFFAPGFAQPPRRVHTSPVYLSPDAGKWVLSYVTPVMNGAEKTAILHYEHSLKVYQQALREGLVGVETFLVAVNADNFIVADSRRDIPIERRGDDEDPARYFERFEFQGFGLDGLRQALGGDEEKGQGMLATPAGAHVIAYKRVGHWTLVAVETSGRES